nr:immunoglobulin light chain junction region [Macaca mulatta]
CSSYAGNNVLV